MTETNFQPIFDYLDNHFRLEIIQDIEDRFGSRFDNLANIMDEVLREVVAMREEQTINNHRFLRLEGWAKPVGRKVNIPFET